LSIPRSETSNIKDKRLKIEGQKADENAEID
jgi:hypothetical protein